MSIEAEAATGGVISTRNGVPPESTASDPPGGVPRHPDPDTHPHPAPSEGEPQPQPGQELPDEPPHVPPRREAQGREAHNGNHRNHHGKHK